MDADIDREASAATLKRALRAIQDLTARLEAAEQARHEPIAIVGMSCRLPGGANDPLAYWRLLRQGRDGIIEAPHDRWSAAARTTLGAAHRAGYLTVPVDRFDAAFFGLSPREADQIDPQHRLLLELAWEALEDAAIPADAIAGTRTGVYVGLSTSEYQARQTRALADARGITGSSFSIAAGRIAYVLGLHGPTLAVDTACSSSLVTVALAVQALRDGQADAALAGGVNLLLSADTFHGMSAMGALSREGRCRTFDAAADGYVRAEGGGVVLLKRLRDAIADGDRIHAVIRGAAVNHDGRSSGLTIPNPAAQQALIRAALEDARLTPDHIDHIEPHGTASALGDPLELRALHAVFTPGRAATDPLIVASGKPAIGHAEAAAGIAALLKVILSIQHGVIPGHRHLRARTPHVPWEEMAIRVPIAELPWPSRQPRRTAGVSAFGFGGTNAHVIVEQAPVAAGGGESAGRALHLLPVSARNDVALAELALRYADLLDREPHALADICFTAGVGRTHFTHRLAVVGEEPSLIAGELKVRAERLTSASATSSRHDGTPLKVGLLLTGDGDASPDALRALLRERVTADVLGACSAAATDLLEQSLLAVIAGTAPNAERLIGTPTYRAACRFAHQLAVATLWRRWGLDPDAVLGFGVGEIAAACVAGHISVQIGCRLAIERAEAPVHLSDPSPVSTGAGAARRAARLPMISARTGSLIRDADLHLLGCFSVTAENAGFDHAVQSLAARGCRTFIEIGAPHAAFASLRERSATGAQPWIALDPTDPDPVRSVLEGFAALYAAGANPSWRRHHEGSTARRIGIPGYPFQRKRHWLEEAGSTDTTVVPGDDRTDRVASGPAAPEIAGAALLVWLRQRLTAALGAEIPADAVAGRTLVELGADSLAVMELRNAIAREFGVSLAAKDVYAASGIEQLAALIESSRMDGSATAGDEQAGTEPAPLSFPQERFWLLQQLAPESAANNIVFVLRIRGALQVDGLQQAVDALVRRHAILRTRLDDADGRLMQIVEPETAVPMRVVDLTGSPSAEREPAWRRVVREEASRPFDLRRVPLLRLVLARCEADEHLLALCIHHGISDGWSLAVFMRELGAAYEARAADAEPSLPPLPLQYADYARWQRSEANEAAIAPQLGFWRERLAGAPLLELPTDRPRPPCRTFRSSTHSTALDASLTQELRELARRSNATLFSTLLAAFSLLASRLSGEHDVVLGTPVASRVRPEFEGLLGCFINNLVLRTDLSGNLTFSQLTARTQTTVHEALANQDVPFERLIAELMPVRDPSRTPFFQVLFNMLPALRPSVMTWGGLEVQPVAPPALAEEAKFDLTLYVADGEQLNLALLYNRDLFSQERVEELLAQYEYTLRQAVENPECPIDEIVLVPPRTARRLPDMRAALEAPPILPLPAMIAASVNDPRRVALRDSHGSWSYGQLLGAADAIASRLRASGVGAGSSVAIHADRSAALVASMLGVLKSGARFTVLDSAHPAERLRSCLALLRPGALLALESAGTLPAHAAGGLAPDTEVIVIGPTPADVVGTTPSLSADMPMVHPACDAYVAFTSGTTGEPKGIVGAHTPVAHFVEWHLRTFGLRGDDRFSMLSGLSHDPLLRDVFTPLALGATLCIPPGDLMTDARGLLEWMAEERISVAHLTPPLAALLTSAVGGDGCLPSLRWAFFGGDLLTIAHVRELMRVAPSVRCVNFYGTTETPQAMSFAEAPVGAGAELLPGGMQVPLGRGIRGAQLLVLRPDLRLCGVGELGEIHVRSPFLSRGYLDDAAQTADSFVVNPATGDAADRLYRTGDLGRYRPDGSVAFAGRRDQQVKIRGVRVELSEIEAVLREHPRVRRAAVVALNGHQERRVAAFVEPVATAAVDRASLRMHLGARLPSQMIPASITLTDRLPLTAGGKVDLRALADMEEHDDPTAAATAVDHPASPAEELIASIWRELLQTESVGRHDNFFDLGGHSLLAARFVASFEGTTGARIHPRELTYQTLGQLAATYASAQSSSGIAQGGGGQDSLFHRLRARLSRLAAGAGGA